MLALEKKEVVEVQLGLEFEAYFISICYLKDIVCYVFHKSHRAMPPTFPEWDWLNNAYFVEMLKSRGYLILPVPQQSCNTMLWLSTTQPYVGSDVKKPRVLIGMELYTVTHKDRKLA